MKISLGALLFAALMSASPAMPAAAPASDPRRIDAPPTNDVASMALSADGRQLALVSGHQGRNHLWVKSLATGEARPLANTEEAVFPFWSPDGKEIGFFARNEMRAINVASGRIRTLVTGLGWPAGGSWSDDGTIVYASHGQYALLWVNDSGGKVRALTQVPTGSDVYAYVHPHFLPDGIHFLFYVQAETNQRGIYLGRLDDTLTHRLVESEAAGVFADGRLYYLQDGILLSRELDLATRQLSSEAAIIDRGVPVGGRSVAALASNGRQVIWRRGSQGSQRQLAWYDRAGRRLGAVGEPFIAGTGAPSLSPDGARVVINYLAEGLGEVGVIDLDGGALTPVSLHPANDSYPVWSADGRSVLFSSKRTVTYEMYSREPGSLAEARKVFDTRGLRHPLGMSADGRYLLFRRNTPDAVLLDTQTGTETVLVPPGAASAQWAQISADGRWIAYGGRHSGSMQVHLYGPLDGNGRSSEPISQTGGGWVRWRADGRELFYAEPDGTIVSVALQWPDGNSVVAGEPQRLFTAPMFSGPEDRNFAQQYAVSPDGQRLIVIEASEAYSPVYLR